MTTRPRTPAPGTPAPGKLALTELAELKARRQPIAMVTAYDAPSGRLADAAGADVILVGDSAAMTVLGHDSTVPATMDEMLILTRAVTRGARRPLIIADMPFGTFQVSDEESVRNAIRFVKEAGADAVKLEGAGPMLSRVRAIVGAGIPVMGHIGLTPQSATMLGGFKAQGRSAEKALALLADARALEAAGCFSIVLEAVPAQVASRVSAALSIPTIGIGAGVECDGQVLVWHDLLGLYDGRAARFVKRYAEVGDTIRSALEVFAADVRERRFPEEQHTYSMPDDELETFEQGVRSSGDAERCAKPDLHEREHADDRREQACPREHDHGRAQPVPPVDDAHAEQEQHERPDDKPELGSEQKLLSRPLVRTTLSKGIASVERKSQREQDKERQREGNEREADDLPLTAESAKAFRASALRKNTAKPSRK
jgi:3-methyl-2-oxobutanoate hydroxymethyltransferase